MRWRSSIFCGLAGCFALAVLLAFAGHPAFTTVAPTGMSAPPAPATSIEAAPAAGLLQPQFDWHGYAAASSGLSAAPAAIRAIVDGHRPTGTALPHYGPLHRRPPPSFS